MDLKMKNKTQIEEINISDIITNPNQPRKEFDKEKLKELSASIISSGLINPIQVKRVGEKYELICGERRLKAHIIAKLKTISTIIKEYNSESDEMTESLIENLHRDNLTSIEKENFITKLWETNKYASKRDLGKALGIDETTVGQNLRAKQIREETGAAGTISTRTLNDAGESMNIEDKKKIFKKVESGKIHSNHVRNIAKVMRTSPLNVKHAFLSDKITIKQADKISKIKDEKTREKMILAHKNIRNIDKSIERNFEKIAPKNKKDLIRTKEVIENFRNNALESQKMTQRTIKSLIECVPMVSLMDDSQLKRLGHFQDLLETNLSNTLELSENLRERIK